MGYIKAADPASKVIYLLFSVEEAGQAFDLGYILVREDGSQALVQRFEGGHLMDGAPLNVYFSGVWYQGQKELLEPEWAAGRIPRPPEALVQLPVEGMPDPVREQYEGYKAAEAAGVGFNWQTVALVAGAGFVLWRLIR